MGSLRWSERKSSPRGCPATTGSLIPEHRSEGQVKLKAGTLYGVLDRLRADGLVEVEREEIVASRLRRYYRLTDSGARLLAAQAQRQQRNATVAVGRLRSLGVTWTGEMA